MYKAYFVSSLEQRTAGCSAAEGSWHTLSQCCSRHDVSRVTRVCLPTPWSPGPVIVADTRRSCSCGAFCLGWLTLSRAAVTCARVGSWSRVTCHRGEAGAASRSAPQVTPAPAGTCGHWRGCSLCCGHPPASSLRSAAGEAGTGQLEAAAAACVWQLGSPPADASCGTGDY